MSDESNPARILLPRLRIPSLSFTDISHSGISNSLRNISSSTSLLSTPSNNIRRVQQIHGTKPKDTASRPRKGGVIPKGPSSTTATRKLLNLQELKRSQAVVRPFVLRKPADLSEYDYSVYAHKVGPNHETEASEKPLIKESQIRAWESAEKVSANVIFDMDASTGDEVGIFEDFNTSMEVASSDEDLSFDGGATEESLDRPIIQSIPDYTKGELKVILDYFDKLQSCDSKVDMFTYEQAEKNALSIYREQQRIFHERAYSSNPKPLARRKLQVFRKRELLHRLFGYSNNINHCYITNNTAYSAFDNVLNATKALQEDHGEITDLMNLEEEFLAIQKEIELKILEEKRKTNSVPLTSNRSYDSVEALELLDMSNSWLTASYENLVCDSNAHSLVEPDVNPEMLACTMAYLKSCVREEI